jgi:hypothetical protein
MVNYLFGKQIMTKYLGIPFYSNKLFVNFWFIIKKFLLKNVKDKRESRKGYVDRLNIFSKA